ncbi:hypothetical protein D3C71_259230 [compost metagenome]
MSAFFVTDKTIADAVQCMNECGIARDGLARDLWNLNVLALQHRYDANPKDYEGAIAAYADPRPSSDPYQLLKSTNCLIYQCSEGDVPETPLYKELERASEALSVRLGEPDMSGERDARYDTAEWDRESEEPAPDAQP